MMTEKELRKILADETDRHYDRLGWAAPHPIAEAIRSGERTHAVDIALAAMKCAAELQPLTE